jgi:hypothetical protein
MRINRIKGEFLNLRLVISMFPKILRLPAAPPPYGRLRRKPKLTATRLIV